VRRLLILSAVSILSVSAAGAADPGAVFEEVPGGDFIQDVSADGAFLAGNLDGRPARFDGDLVPEELG